MGRRRILTYVVFLAFTALVIGGMRWYQARTKASAKDQANQLVELLSGMDDRYREVSVSVTPKFKPRLVGEVRTAGDLAALRARVVAALGESEAGRVVQDVAVVATATTMTTMPFIPATQPAK